MPKDQLMSDYAEQMARLINEPTLALDWYTTADAAAVFGVSTATVRSWCDKGWIKHDIRIPEAHVGKRHNTIARREIPASEIDRIQRAGPKLLSYTKRVWVRYLWKLEHGEKVR